jgi:pantoate--beta-alanine ligase
MRANTLKRSIDEFNDESKLGAGTICHLEIVRDFVCGKTQAHRLVHEIGAHMAALIGSPSSFDFFSSLIPRRSRARHAPEHQTKMPSPPIIARTVRALHRAIDDYRGRKATIALVPTMGALHDGHMSLVRLAKRRARRVIVSIFVNPTQFAPTEDYGAYPRTWKADVARLAAEAVDIVWNPGVETMYPDGFATQIVPGGAATVGLEDRFRPHFFGGVATVVGKLFVQCRPDVAVFGEKDFQQLRVVAQMARDLDLGVRVVGSKTVRERDGLAMSSRNVYLTPEQRRAAPELFRAMKQASARLRAGDDIEAAVADGIEAIRGAGFALDYFEVRHADTLAPVGAVRNSKLRILVAARLGNTRLIDNIAV